MKPAADTSYKQILSTAWPIMVANAAVPLLGLVDTAVIGHSGDVADLGAIALGSLIFNVVFWSFGFLRMSTTGFIAQARGAGDEAEVRATLGRALLLASGIGLTLLALQYPLTRLALALLNGSDAVETETATYVLTRLWGAPATLASFAIMGTLIGLGQSRLLLFLQLFLNGLNALLDITFAGHWGWGAFGVALGSAIADWAAALLGFALLYRRLQTSRSRLEPFWSQAALFHSARLWRMLRANADIMLRTLFLLLGFAWFTQQGALLGDGALAANHVLLQFISFCAFFLDGYAFSTEAVVGKAFGARQLAAFDSAVQRSTILAVVTALGLGALLLGFGDIAIQLLTDLPEVRALSARYLDYVALYVAVAVWAFQLDGIFIGATRTRDMRNASLLSVVGFLALGYPLTYAYGNHGLWLAFIGFALFRALSLGALYPRLRRALAGTALR